MSHESTCKALLSQDPACASVHSWAQPSGAGVVAEPQCRQTGDGARAWTFAHPRIESVSLLVCCLVAAGSSTPIWGGCLEQARLHLVSTVCNVDAKPFCCCSLAVVLPAWRTRLQRRHRIPLVLAVASTRRHLPRVAAAGGKSCVRTSCRSTSQPM